MKAAVFFFETCDVDVWSGRQIDLDAWRYNTKMFGLDTLIMIDKIPGGSKYQHFDEEQKFFRYTEISEFEAAHPNLHQYWFESPWSFPKSVIPTKLRDLKHAKDDVAYIFGPAVGFQIPEGDKKSWVTVPQKGLGATHAIFLAPIVFYDRALKLKEIN